MVPNLFLVGAMKSGTTSLYHYLAQHPDIHFPDVKEPHYYALRDIEPYIGGMGDDKRYQDTFILSSDKYQNLFRNGGEYQYQGDASAMYLYYHECAGAIKNDSPDARIIIALRNPIDRAYSSYTHLIRDGRESLSFEEGLEAESERIENRFLPIWYYKEAGMYYQQVKEFIDVFGREKVKVVLYEDIKQNATAVVEEILTFLGLSTHLNIETGTKFNVSGKPKNRWFQTALNSDLKVKRAIASLMPSGVRSALKSKLLNMNYDRFPPLESSVRDDLRRYFSDDVKNLSNLIGMDLKHWDFGQ